VKAAVAAFKRAPKDWLKRGVRRAVRATAPQRSGISPGYFGLGQNEQGALTLASVKLAELSNTWGSPLHVVNAARLRDNARRFMSAAPACEVFFSYKTNPVPGAMKELHALGIGAEVISEYELWLALKLGVAPSKIVYNGPQNQSLRSVAPSSSTSRC
jgi:diaminopimelate decarboxylase